MTPDEKYKLLLYLTQTASRADSAVDDALQLYLLRKDLRSCMRLCEAVAVRDAFNKFYHDLSALLEF